MTLMSGSYSFLFRDSAGERERLEKAIVYALREAQIQNKVALKNIRAGAFLIGSKKQCLRIQIDSTAYITVSCIDVGTFLYVSVFREEKIGFFSNQKRKMTADDVFKQQGQDAVLCAILACCEKAFELLEITDKEVKM